MAEYEYLAAECISIASDRYVKNYLTIQRNQHLCPYHHSKIKMKTVAALLLVWLSSVTASPAVVWRNGKHSTPVVHNSDDVSVFDLLSSVMEGSDDFAFPTVVFLLSRNEDGSDGLTKLGSDGALPTVASKYDHAESIHHHVSGVESPVTVVRDVAAAKSTNRPLQVTMSEFSSKLMSLAEPVQEVVISGEGLMSKAVKESGKRARAVNQSNVFVVTVDPSADPTAIDSAIADAIAHNDVGSVVLSAVRSIAEVKRARVLQNRRRAESMYTANRSKLMPGSRRLEDANQDDDGNANGDDADMTGVYYVSMTPNILAGLLFFLLFAVVTYIGVSCMGMISGQTVYVTKMPSIGREA